MTKKNKKWCPFAKVNVNMLIHSRGNISVNRLQNSDPAPGTHCLGNGCAVWIEKINCTCKICKKEITKINQGKCGLINNVWS